MTDPADDGLRMPIPPASLKIKKPKKKKKWSRKLWFFIKFIYIIKLSIYKSIVINFSI